jgi:DnaJ-domain-containing protein 1
MLVVQTDSSIVSLGWFGEFLLSHSRDTIFLPMSAVIFFDENLLKERKEFLLKLAKYYSLKTEMYFEQLLKHLLMYKKKPIKIEFKQKQIVRSDVDVYLDAISHKDVKILLREPNPWITSFFSSQLDKFIVEFDERRLFLNTTEERAKTRLDRVLKKKDIIFFNIKYDYSKNFLTILFTDPKKERRKFGQNRKKSFNSENYHQDRVLLHHYGILELAYGATLKDVKNNYRRLAKMYHPDRVHHKNETIVELYTKKFQDIQTSYHFLKEHLETH